MATPPHAGAEEFDAVLSDGRTIRVRPIHPEDKDRLAAFHARLSPETIHMRFFSPHPRLSDRELQRFTEVDGRDRAALVATIGDEIVAVVRYDRYPGTDEAEVAFVVDDAHQGRGIATLLLEHLAAAARRNGIARFGAETLAQNRRMLGVFRAAGFSTHASLDHDVVHVSFPIAPDERFLEAMEARERGADVASLRPILRPRSIAVIGNSVVAKQVHRNVVSGGFMGSVVAIDSYKELADAADLAVIDVPRPNLEAAVTHCGSAGVGGVVVLSEGDHGIARLAHRDGMRLVGPRSIGVLNTDPDVRMNATTHDESVVHGRVGFFSQSGAIGIAALARASEVGVGISMFVSAGDKADVSGNDLLLFWEEDDATDVVLLSIESFGNPRKFARIARRVTRRKPIVALLHGDAVPDDVAGAVFEHTGVIRVATTEELLETALAPPHPLQAEPDVDTALGDIEPYLRRLR